MSVRRLRAKPQLAVAQALPASAPKVSDSPAITTSTAPYCTMTPMEHPALIWFTRFAVTNGMMHSITTSPETNSGASSEGFLYSRMLLAKTLSIKRYPFLSGSEEPFCIICYDANNSAQKNQPQSLRPPCDRQCGPTRPCGLPPAALEF